MDNCHSIVDKPMHNLWKIKYIFPTGYTQAYPQFHILASNPQAPHYLILLQLIHLTLQSHPSYYLPIQYPHSLAFLSPLVLP